MDQQTIQCDRLVRNDVQAVALSNFDEDGPAAALEEAAESKNVDWRMCHVTRKKRTRGSTKLRDRGERF